MKKIDKSLILKVFKKEPLIILIGQSGSGKGTLQKNLFALYKELCGEEAPCCFFETGDLFRKNIPLLSSWNTHRLHEIQEAGKFQSSFIASIMWGEAFLTKYEGGPIILDGSPRNVGEVDNLIELFCRYAGKEIIAFCLEVSDEEADRRMQRRNRHLKKAGLPVRSDTVTPEARATKLALFHTSVVPAMELLKQKMTVSVYSIDATKSVKKGVNQVLSILQTCT